jgi:glycine cleavage system H protein
MVGARQYTRTHEWVTVEGKVATIGITDYAQAQLGDVVYIELPPEGKQLKIGEVFGVIESIKAASDLFSPVAGRVIEVNTELETNPDLVNQDPHGRGWLLRADLYDPIEGLLDEAGYNALLEAS